MVYLGLVAVPCCYLLFGVARTEQGHLENPQLAQHFYRQEPVSVLDFLRSPHTNASMKQYECGRTQPLLRMGHNCVKTSGRNLKG